MLLHAETLEDCPTTGTMLVQWVRKVGRASALSFVSLKRSVCVGLFTEFMVFCWHSFLSFVVTENTS
jgi:hypothetical protein